MVNRGRGVGAQRPRSSGGAGHRGAGLRRSAARDPRGGAATPHQAAPRRRCRRAGAPRSQDEGQGWDSLVRSTLGGLTRARGGRVQAGSTRPSGSPGGDLPHPESSAAPFQTLPPNWTAQGWRLRSQLRGEGCYSSPDETGNTHQGSHPGSPPRLGLGNCFNGNLIWERHPKVPRAFITLRMHLGLTAGAPSSAPFSSTLTSPAPGFCLVYLGQTLCLPQPNIFWAAGAPGKLHPSHTWRTSGRTCQGCRL